MKQLKLPWFEEENKKIHLKSENNKTTDNLVDILSIEADKCPSCDEMTFYNWVCGNCGYWQEVKIKFKDKEWEFKAEYIETAEVDVAEKKDFDNNETHIKELLRRLELKDTFKMWFILFWEYFDIEIVNWSIDEIEVSWLTFKYSMKEWKFIVVAKEKWFLRWNAYKYKRRFLKWIRENKKSKFKLNTIKSHPYFDDFLWK